MTFVIQEKEKPKSLIFSPTLWSLVEASAWKSSLVLQVFVLVHQNIISGWWHLGPVKSWLLRNPQHIFICNPQETMGGFWCSGLGCQLMPAEKIGSGTGGVWATDVEMGICVYSWCGLLVLDGAQLKALRGMLMQKLPSDCNITSELIHVNSSCGYKELFSPHRGNILQKFISKLKNTNPPKQRPTKNNSIK